MNVFAPAVGALALAAAAWEPAAAMQAGGNVPPPAAETAETSEMSETPPGWRAEMNEAVAEENHWRWRLRFLERRGDELAVGLSYRNGAATGRPIYLETGHMETVALIDRENGARFPLLAVEGVSANATAVERRSSQFAEFVFRFPEGARAVTFASRWISMQMQGAAKVMEVAFPIALPAAGAGPG